VTGVPTGGGPADEAAVIAVVVNGERWELPAGSTVAGVVARLTAVPRGIAVALDGAVVPRPGWDATAVPAGATVEILTAVQGG
jgi:sulfur carrier protein